MKYRSLLPKFIFRSKTHFPKVRHSSIKYYLRYNTKLLDREKIGYCDLHFFGQRSHYYDSLSHSMVVTIKYYLRDKAKSLDHEKIDHCDLHCFRAKATLHWLIITKYNVQTSVSLQDIRQNHWTMKYRSQTYKCFEVRCRVILTPSPKVWCSATE